MSYKIHGPMWGDLEVVLTQVLVHCPVSASEGPVWCPGTSSSCSHPETIPLCSSLLNVLFLFRISHHEEKVAMLLLLTLLWPIAIRLKPPLVERIRLGPVGRVRKRVLSEQGEFVLHLAQLSTKSLCQWGPMRTQKSLLALQSNCLENTWRGTQPYLEHCLTGGAKPVGVGMRWLGWPLC